MQHLLLSSPVHYPHCHSTLTTATPSVLGAPFPDIPALPRVHGNPAGCPTVRVVRRELQKLLLK